MENKDKFKFCKDVQSVLVDYFNFNVDVAFFIGCQFGLESNFGRSKMALEQFNFCGMRRSLVRISTSKNPPISLCRNFACYRSFLECIIDFVLCLQYRKPISTNLDTISHYCAFIKTWYCPEMDYISKIQSIYNQLKSNQNE